MIKGWKNQEKSFFDLIFVLKIVKTMEKSLIILKELKHYLIAEFGENILDVILFGSQADGVYKEGSDFDILIVLSHDYDWKYQEGIFDKAFDIGLKYSVLFDIHLLSLNEKNNKLKGKEPLIVNALEKGIYA